MHERKIIKINENRAILRIFQKNSKAKAKTISIKVMIGAKKYKLGKPYCIRISENPFISAAFLWLILGKSKLRKLLKFWKKIVCFSLSRFFLVNQLLFNYKVTVKCFFLFKRCNYCFLKRGIFYFDITFPK